MLTKRIGRSTTPGAPSVCSFSSRNRARSWVHATTSSSPLLAARWNAPASRRHSVVCTVCSPSLRSGPTAFVRPGPSSVIVLLQSQISVVIGNRFRWGGRCGRLVVVALVVALLVFEQAQELRLVHL